jgi:hypothetical protein
MRESRKPKDKISGSEATVKGKWPYYNVMNFWNTTCSVELRLEMSHRQHLQPFTDPGENEMGNSDLEGENIS